jgi:hypothetical protein
VLISISFWFKISIYDNLYQKGAHMNTIERQKSVLDYQEKRGEYSDQELIGFPKVSKEVPAYVA